MDINVAMLNYLRGCEELGYFLKFNTITTSVGEVSIDTISSDYALKRYTNGDQLKEYIFAIVLMKLHDTGDLSDINTESMYDATKVAEWIDEQNRIGNLPAISGVQSIENLQNMPDIAGVDENGVAKYLMQCKVTYIEERKR